MSSAKLDDIGEHRAVEMLLERVLAGRPGWEVLPPGDDASCVRIGSICLVLKVDGARLHSLRTPWMSMYDVGWQAVAATASDLAAKAARPLAFLASVGLPATTPYSELEELVRGAADAAEAHGGKLLGGDTNAGEGWVDVAGIGIAAGRPPPLNGAKPGDRVYITAGRVGVAGMVLDSMYRGVWRSYIKRYPNLYHEFSRPRARVEFAELNEKLPGCITASTDSSDGLAYSLWRLARSSKHTIRLDRLPQVPAEVEEYAKEQGVALETLVLYGGQEYEIIFTARSSCTAELEKEASSLGLTVEPIGEVLPGEPKVVLNNKQLAEKGWDNFKQA